MTEAQVKHEIAVAFEYSYQHDAWVEPLETVFDGLTAEQAARRLVPNSTTIWEIVLHLALWHENMIDRIETGQPIHPPVAWPPTPETANEAEWEEAKMRLRDALESVREIIEREPLDKLASHYGLADLLCRATHNGYHLGQIIKMRELTQQRV